MHYLLLSSRDKLLVGAVTLVRSVVLFIICHRYGTVLAVMFLYRT